ncbi:response regulator transcription factor [Ammoniphilus sp. CFH 90114]|uniref:response regulator n=1 Tax=Ammoniphilus sp. CFH 90114 TaxID=2493665 RepID=UPI00100E2035|nr:response regulator transcription factor [Ammoniphilus sp. CFH 90114]RXT04491.1 response regulator transcription factor [Ammoniphilus sp. CFH 90114]
MADTIRIALIDDHQLFREGIKRILEMEPSFEVVGIGSNGEEACHLAEELKPEIMLMDINMPKMSGVEATEKIKALSPETKVIILSIHDDENYVHQAFSSGANGYLLKEMESDSLIEAIQVVAGGEAYIHPRVTGKLITEFRRLSSKQDNDIAHVELADNVSAERFNSLTPREKEVLQLMAEGRSNKAIGDYLYISEKTVKNHVSSILQKLDVQDRTQAVVISIKNGWVKIS